MLNTNVDSLVSQLYKQIKLDETLKVDQVIHEKTGSNEKWNDVDHDLIQFRKSNLQRFIRCIENKTLLIFLDNVEENVI